MFSGAARRRTACCSFMTGLAAMPATAGCTSGSSGADRAGLDVVQQYADAGTALIGAILAGHRAPTHCLSDAGDSGSRRAATGVRRDRGAHQQTVEDPDRRCCRRRPLTWRFSGAFTVLNTVQFLARRSSTDLARRKSGDKNPLTSNLRQPQSPAWPVAPAGPRTFQHFSPGNKRPASSPRAGLPGTSQVNGVVGRDQWLR
jgi:hypothetical protein